MSMKNSNDTIGNRTRDLPACNAVPQPTALPRAPIYSYQLCKNIDYCLIECDAVQSTTRILIQVFLRSLCLSKKLHGLTFHKIIIFTKEGCVSTRKGDLGSIPSRVRVRHLLQSKQKSCRNSRSSFFR